jgi:hypothetical protein
MNETIYFLRKLPERFIRAVSIIITFENWQIWFQDRYNFFHNYSQGEELIVYLRNGIKFYTKFRKGELGALKDIWCQKIYTKYSKIKKGDVVIDIGTNIGAFSLFAATTAQNAAVFSYEPTRKRFQGWLKILGRIIWKS